MISLRALQHAIALVDHGRFTAAARAVHLSQPALSRSIQALERQLGTRLFDRLVGAVRPTDAGVIFLNQARLLVAQAEAFELEAGKVRRAGEADIVVGTGTYCAEGLVDLAVTRLLGRRHLARISVLAGTWASLLQALRRQEVQLVVADATIAEEDATLLVEPLARSQGLFAVRAGHPLAQRPRATLADVTGFPLVTTSRPTARVMEPLLESVPRDRRAQVPAVTCESLSMMKAIALGSDAVAILPMRAMFAEVNAGDLVALPLRPPWLYGRFGVIRRRGDPATGVTSHFLDALREIDAETDAHARRLERRLLGARPSRGGSRRAPRAKARPDG